MILARRHRREGRAGSSCLSHFRCRCPPPPPPGCRTRPPPPAWVAVILPVQLHMDSDTLPGVCRASALTGLGRSAPGPGHAGPGPGPMQLTHASNRRHDDGPFAKRCVSLKCPTDSPFPVRGLVDVKRGRA